MKRWIFKLVVFLLLGAVVNVAVAWGCVLLLYWDLSYRKTVTHTPQIAKELCMRYNPVGSEIPVAMFEGWEEIYLGHRLSIAVVPSELSFVITHVVSAGWPIYSMRGVLRVAHGDGVLRSLWLLPRKSRPYPIAIPLRPIWPGFAINTFFYAAILWFLTLGPFTARRIIRRKHGLCIKCGYDLRGTSGGGCPECGWRREPAA